MSKVSVPRNVEELLTLANAIYAKHLADGASSPLNQLEDFNFTEAGPDIQLALARHNDAEDLRRKMEKAYEERDALMDNIDGAVKASRDLLKAKFAKNPKTLGDWGFDVAEGKTAKPKEESKKAG